MNCARLVKLPAPLAPGGNLSVGALVRRNHRSETGASIWLGRNFAFNGKPPDSYFHLGTVRRFAFHGKLASSLPAGCPVLPISNPVPPFAAQPITLVDGPQVQLDGVDLILPEFFDFDALVNATLLFVGDEILSVAAATLTGPGAFDLQVIRGRFGTVPATHLAGMEIFIIALADLTILQHPSFVPGGTSLFKLAIGVQQPSAIAAFELAL